MQNSRISFLSLVLETNEDGYLARCPGIQGAFAEGDTIYIKGEPSNDRFGLILSGSVHIVTKDGEVFKVVSSGDVIGEIALSDPNHKRTMTVEAATATEILEWDVNHIKQEVPGLWKNLVKLAWEHMREYYEDVE